MNLLLDTCAILWIVGEPGKISELTTSILQEPGREVYVSAISCGEIACAAQRGRIQLDSHWKTWFRKYVELNNWELVPLDLGIMEEAYSLPECFHADPADRVIVATARKMSLAVVTGDAKILDYPHVETIW